MHHNKNFGNSNIWFQFYKSCYQIHHKIWAFDREAMLHVELKSQELFVEVDVLEDQIQEDNENG